MILIRVMCVLDTAWNDVDGIPRSVTAYAPKHSSVGVITKDTIPPSAWFTGAGTNGGSDRGKESIHMKHSASYNIFGTNDDHGGSRNRLLFTRKQRDIEGNQMKLDLADARKGPGMSTKRMNLITNMDIENGR